MLEINNWDQDIRRHHNSPRFLHYNNHLHPIDTPHYCFDRHNNHLLSKQNFQDKQKQKYNSSDLHWIQEMQDNHQLYYSLDLFDNHHLYNNPLHYLHMDLPEMIILLFFFNSFNFLGWTKPSWANLSQALLSKAKSRSKYWNLLTSGFWLLNS